MVFELSEFENKVLLGLKKCGIKDFDQHKDSLRIGAAVSGGADSVSLLLALCKICSRIGASLFVITVNHNIREEAETGGDADFVRKLCDQLRNNGFEVLFDLAEIERGKVFEFSELRGGGIEEAARTLRYELFNSFIEKNNLDFLCLAHNQKDQLETALMRFLQGSGVDASCGIKRVRGKYVRPLLDIGRDEIENYLKDCGQSWRTDSTNSDDSYLRNNIRLNLIPLLEKKFPGWKKGILSGIEKNIIDSKIFEKKVSDFNLSVCSDNETGAFVNIDCEAFFASEEAVQLRVIAKAMNLCGQKNRIPYAFLQEVLSFLNDKKNGKKCFGNTEILYKNNNISVKKAVKTATDFVFSDIINRGKTFNFPFGIVEVEEKSADYTDRFDVFINGDLAVENCKLPVLVRSFLPDDEILCSNGCYKKVSDIFSSWHVPENQRNLIPLIQDLNDKNQRVLCIFGKAYGFNNWIVK